MTEVATQKETYIRECKGMCESCGFAFQGTIDMWADLKCPKCGEVTQNFDEADDVDALNEANDHGVIEYTKVEKFEYQA